MESPLNIDRIDMSPLDFLNSNGEVFAVFDERTQDSGNVSYGWAVHHERRFVKTAGAPDATAFLPHIERVAWLRNAVVLANSVQHEALVPLERTVESPHGPMLVCKWVDGELIRVPAARRSDPDSSYQRFRLLPLPELLAALDSVFDCHRVICAAGWVASDFYDGAMVYDFQTHTMALVDLDLYRHGPIINDMGRMFGSSRFMAPEEFKAGATIDERTTVFNMGRCIHEFVATRADATPSVLAIAARACAPEPDERFQTISEFYAAWHSAWRGAVDITGIDLTPAAAERQSGQSLPA